jgi:chromosomal replication initiation ATPase DnaA
VTGFLHALVEDAAREAGVPVSVILGHRRQRPIVLARQRAMKAAFEEGFSSPQIGRAFNRDHTTVLYAAGVLSGKTPGDGRP